MLPVAQRREGRFAAARPARPVAQHGQVATVVADVADQEDDIGALALEQRQRGARRAREGAVQVHVGHAREAQAGEARVEPRDQEIVPGELDRDGLADEPVAQSGGGEHTTCSVQKASAREYVSHVT